MGWGDLAVAFGKVVSTEVRGALKSVLANLSFLEHDGDEGEASFNKSMSEPMYGAGPLFWRPKAPVKKSAATGLSPEGHAEVVALRSGDEAIPVGYRDLRLNAQANPKEGEVVIAQYGGGFISLKDNDDGNGTSITHYALRKNPDGSAAKAHLLQMETKASSSHVTLVHESGSSVVLNTDGDVVITGKDGKAWAQMKADGSVVISGTSVAITGGVMLGDKDPSLGDAVMLSTQLLAWIGQVNAALVAAAAASGLNPNPTIIAPTAVPAAATVTKAK